MHKAKRAIWIVAAIILAASVSQADAKTRKHHHRIHQATSYEQSTGCDRLTQQECVNGGAASIRYSGYAPAVSYSSGETVSHPGGCPWRAFCGCGASVHVFGRSIRSLWLAAAWFRFPRASPAPGMAAVRSHHVMVLESHVSGNVWVVYDANSDGHQTRVHERSIAGYTIVNPHGASVAMN